MRNYIILNGKNSNEINGLLIQELPPISKPLIRTEVEEIDGRDGDIVTPLGYSAYDKEFTIGLYKDFDVNEVAAYFNSEGTVIFSNEPDKYYYYQITAQIDFERLVRYRTATVTMHCQPFKYSATEQPITEDVSGTVSDEGTNLALENTAEAPFNTLDLKGNTSQQTYSGKNLYPLIASTTNNGITYTQNADGTYNISGTSTAQANAVLWLDDISAFVDGQTYTISASPAPTNVSVLVEVYNGTTWLRNGNVATGGTPSQPKVLDLTNADRLKFTFRVANGTTVNLSGLKIQLEKGSSATAWERYVGGTASPNPDYSQAVQTVTGENVVKINGKNLADIPDFSISGSGYAVGASNGAVSVDSTTTNRAISLCSGADGGAWLPAYTSSSVIDHHITGNGGSYTISLANIAKTITGNQAFYVSVYTNKRSVANTTLTSSSNFAPSTITLDSDEHIKDIWIWIGGNTTYNVSFNIQLELGSSASSFEPYQGQSYEVNLGKNLFDKDNANIFNGYLGNSGIVEAANARAIYIPVVAGQTYTFSRANSTSQVNDPFYAFIANEPVGGGQYLGGRHAVGQHDLTFTTGTAPAGSKYLIFYFAWNPSAETLATILSTYQLELGSQATSYAAYFEPIELCKIGGYQDYIYKSGDKWYKHKAINKEILDGSGTWTAGGQNNAYIWRAPVSDLVMPSAASVLADIICSHLKVVTFSDIYYARDTGIAVPGNGQRICISTMTDVATTKAWLDANTPSVYYVLATPVDEEITNSTLIEQLDNIYYHAHAYKGRTHISSSAATGNVPHIIAAEVGEDNESTITNAGNYLSKPKITVYGSGDISLYINDMHVLQITLGDEGYITIDTAQMEAYKDTLDNLKNRLVIGDYSNARLKPGANKIHFTGTVTKYVVENYSRWL